MKKVELTIKQQPELYLETEIITPDVFAGKSVEQIEALPVYEGNVMHKLGDFFSVTGVPADTAAFRNCMLCCITTTGSSSP